MNAATSSSTVPVAVAPPPVPSTLRPKTPLSVVAFISSAAIFIPMVRRGRLDGRGLLIGGVFYLGYLAIVVAEILGLL